MAKEAAKSATALTAKQEAFCLEYLIDLNATQAAIRAGYGEKTARQVAAQNLSKLNIQNRIAELKNTRNEQASVNSLYVLNRLVAIDQMDVLDILDDTGNILPISQWPKTWRTSINAVDVVEIASGNQDAASVLKKIKWPDKTKNLELLGKHVDIQAFKEQLKMSGNVGIEAISSIMDELSE